MAVISPNKAWPNGRVPYVAETSEIESWLLEINAATGFPLLVPKGISDFDYISAQRGGGKSESIGYIQGHGEHKITASRKFSMQHELLHALGFHHEQLHKNGPWGAFGTKANSAERIDEELLKQWGLNMLPPDSRPTIKVSTPSKVKSLDEPIKKLETSTTRPRRSSISGGDKIILPINQEAINQHKRAPDYQ